MKHLLQWDNNVHLDGIDVGVSVSSLLSWVTHEINLETLWFLIGQWLKGAFQMMNHSLYFESKHKSWLKNFLESSKGSHLESRVVPLNIA